MVIAIDGPAASGKTITAKLIAEKLGFKHLDTGAMYRAIALYFIRNKITKFDDSSYLQSILETINIEYSFSNNLIILNGEDVSDRIRKADIADNVSKISSVKLVRKYLVQIQQNISTNKNIVVEGRDIGTVVFPNAEIKIFLFADLNSRVKRRYAQLSTFDSKIDKNEIEKSIIKRDRMDSTRLDSPLIRASDALEIDTTNLTIEEQTEKILKIIKRKINGRKFN